MNTENIRATWVEQLWKRKGFDSPEEFKERGTCIACGLDVGNLSVRTVGADSYPHLLCEFCLSASESLSDFGYWRWFFKRKAADTIAAATLQRLILT